MLDGAARKIALPFVLLSSVGWVAYAVGFGIRNFQLSEQLGRPATDVEYVPYWCFGVAAILLYAVTITHLFCGNPITIFLIMFFQPFFYTCSGIILYLNGAYIRTEWEAGRQDQLHQVYYEYIIETAGACASVIFYWIALMFWPCFRKKEDFDDS